MNREPYRGSLLSKHMLCNIVCHLFLEQKANI